MRRGKWCEILRTKSLPALRDWVCSPSTGPQESKEKLPKHWKYWEQQCPSLLLFLHIEEEVPRKVKSNRVPSYTHLNSVALKKGLLIQGPLRK